jgi:hypothetical protein
VKLKSFLTDLYKLLPYFAGGRFLFSFDMPFYYDLVTLERERPKKVGGGVGVKGLQVTFVTLSQNGQELCTEEKFLRVNEIAKLAVKRVRIFFFREKGGKKVTGKL